jgi:hypothetical protein
MCTLYFNLALRCDMSSLPKKQNPSVPKSKTHCPLLLLLPPHSPRLQDSGKPWSLVFTKLDLHPSLSLPHPLQNMERFLAALEQLLGPTRSTSKPDPYPVVPFVPTSSATGLGREALLKYISSLCQSFRLSVPAFEALAPPTPGRRGGRAS